MTDVRRSITGVFRQLRQPEYTGENRCRPCTLLNTAIAGMLGIAVAIYWIPVGVGTFVLGLSIIAVRGYLVPGTPTLVQYFPEWVHAALGTEHHLETLDAEFDVERTLKDADIVRECPESDDLCLTAGFRSAWQEEMAELREQNEQRYRLSDSLSVPANEVSFEETDFGWEVYIDDVRAGRWQSQAAFVADLASEGLLGTRLDRWESVDAESRTRLLTALRSFVEECPTCGGEVAADEDVVRSCCRGDIVSVTTACLECDAVLFEGEVS